jgi:hypothetical protein
MTTRQDLMRDDLRGLVLKYADVSIEEMIDLFEEEIRHITSE